MRVETILERLEDNATEKSEQNVDNVNRIKKITDRKIKSFKTTDFEDAEVIFGMLFSLKEFVENSEEDTSRILELSRRIME